MASRTAITAILSASRLQSAPLRLICGRAACRSAAAAAARTGSPAVLRRRPGDLAAFRLYSTEPSPPSTAGTETSPTVSSKASAAQDVIERYRARLESKAQKEGVADIEQLREAYTDKIQALRRRDAVLPKGATISAETPVVEAVGAVEAGKEATQTEATTSAGSSRPSTPLSTSETESTTSTAPSSPSPSTSSSSSPPSTPSGVRSLSSYLDLDKVRMLPTEELSAIWRLRFANDPLSLCAVIPAQTYAAMEAAARARPQFVLPVPHPEQGAEIHFLQWTFDTQGEHAGATPSSTVLFTQLAEYKVRGEFAQPHTTVTHYTDLAADCGVVLMQGQVDDGRGVTADHAQWLVMCLQRFYGAWAIPGSSGADQLDEGARARRLLLQWFAAGDPQFSIERLMEEVEKLA
ncbi:hypothetical protein SCUCBS95973_005152 [Sporothrix curviconia]|uniref:F1f0 ATP synthase assembly protein n=1 Tax=Sporothrix curviconia TaxID=1260050 RepID=A0ABP0BUL3_9PEZI